MGEEEEEEVVVVVGWEGKGEATPGGENDVR